MSDESLRVPKAQVSEVLRVNTVPGISDAAVRVWLFYRQHHIGDRGAFVTDTTTASALGMSERTVQRARKELIDRELLRVRRNGPKPASFFPCGPSNDSPPVANQTLKDPPPVAKQPDDRVATSGETNERPATSGETDSKESPLESPLVATTIKGLSPSLNRTTWLTPFADAWVERFGPEVEVPFKRMAAAFKSLTKKGTPEPRLVNAWRAYLSDVDPRYANPQNFSQSWTEWDVSTNRSARAGKGNGGNPYDGYMTPAQAAAALEEAAGG